MGLVDGIRGARAVAFEVGSIHGVAEDKLPLAGADVRSGVGL